MRSCQVVASSWVVAWSDTDVRFALLMALASHAVMRVGSLVDFVPKAAAARWTRRSLLRLPLDLVSCAAMLAGGRFGAARIAANWHSYRHDG
jgi:hypothetical protein